MSAIATTDSRNLGVRLSILYCTSSFSLDADLTLERAHPPDHFGQPRDHGRVTAPMSNRHRGDATDHDVVIQIIVDAGLCRDHHAIPDLRMIGASRLSSELAPFADFHRPCDSDLRGK